MIAAASLPAVDLSRLRIESATAEWAETTAGVALHLTMQVKCVETGAIIPITMKAMPSSSIISKGGRVLRAFVRQSVLTMLAHEMDETLFMEGERIAVPHPKPVTVAPTGPIQTMDLKGGIPT